MSAARLLLGAAGGFVIAVVVTQLIQDIVTAAIVSCTAACVWGWFGPSAILPYDHD